MVKYRKKPVLGSGRSKQKTVNIDFFQQRILSVFQHPNVKQPALPGPASLGRKERRKKKNAGPQEWQGGDDK